MLIKIGDTTLETCLTTRNMALFEEKFEIKDTLQFWKRAAAGPNIKILANAIFQFSKEITSVDDAYDFIDACRAEGKSVYTLYEELIREVNAGGFFRKIFTPEELREELNSPALDLDQIVNSVANSAAKDMIIGAV